MLEHSQTPGARCWLCGKTADPTAHHGILTYTVADDRHTCEDCKAFLVDVRPIAPSTPRHARRHWIRALAANPLTLLTLVSLAATTSIAAFVIVTR